MRGLAGQGGPGQAPRPAPGCDRTEANAVVATGYAGGDPAKVSRTGDTMTGDLILDDASPAASEAYVAAHGGGRYLEFDQSSPSSNWTITHNFGVYPQVSILDASGVVVLIAPTHLSVNQLNLTFPTPFAGKAVLSA